MKYQQITPAVIALAAGLAQGGVFGASFEQHNALDTNGARTGGGTLEMCIDLAGLDSWDADGDISNVVVEQFLGAGASIVATKWENVELATSGNSFLSQAAIGFNDEIVVRVGDGDAFGGTKTYSSDGIFDFSEHNTHYDLGDDGLLSLEFFETEDDGTDTVDASYLGGKLYVYYIPAVPSPGSYAILGVAGLVVTRRKRG